MKAVVFTAFGDPDVLAVQEVADPEPQGDDVLIRSAAIGINPVDLKIRSGAYKDVIPVKPPAILGRDVAGTVVKAGPQSQVAAGARVMALSNATYAEMVNAKHVEYCEVPEGMSLETAATLPVVCLTGAQLIEETAKVQSGQTVLITGAVGAVGRVAVHVAKKLGARVFAGVRTGQKEEARSLNVEHVVAIDDPQELSLIRNMDVVAETSGNRDLGEALLRTLTAGGVYATTTAPPEKTDDFDVRIAMVQVHTDRDRLAQLAADAARGEFEIPFGAKYRLDEAATAHRDLEAHKVSGKVVLVP